MIELYNTLSRKLEPFEPIRDNEARIYTCGPTVYIDAHIGNLRTYVFEDILVRALRYNGLKVKRVMNITDVGHLTSDADTGEDKMAVSARRERKTPEEIAERYTEVFKNDIHELNILEPDVWAKATDYIVDMIEFVKILEEKGFAYRTSEAVYFDTSKLDDYGKLARLDLEGQQAGARVELSEEKRNPWDFVVWVIADPKHIMQWDSPWGRGYPGWHLECSVISMKHLGEVFDIHCGGIDHIPIHHTNEIAQSQGVTGKVPARFWMHADFLQVEGGRMGKSEGNAYTLEEIKEKGIAPMSLRYFYLTAHYRSKLNFTWDAIQGAGIALDKLYAFVSELPPPEPSESEYREKFLRHINHDLNVPGALGLLWDLVRDESIPTVEKHGLLLDFDRVLGLRLDQVKPFEVPEDIREKVNEREEARKARDFERADRLRDEILERGFSVEDTPEGPKVRRTSGTNL
jgi:cysteinyl-tRNA synthetase